MTRALDIGDPLPWLTLPCADGASVYHLDKAGGRYVAILLCTKAAGVALRLAPLAHRPGLADGQNRLIFTITPEGAQAASDPQQPGLVHLADPDREALRTIGLGGQEAAWILLDPMLRIAARIADDAAGVLFDLLPRLPAFAERGDPYPAPVAILRDAFEPAFCAELIAEYQARGAHESGVFTQSPDGRAHRAMDPGFKRRRDCILQTPALLEGARRRIVGRIVPEIRRVFQMQGDYLERIVIANYDSRERGRFGAHRDNTMPITEHRQFAISINLNDAFDGGDLVFPEYGPRRYRPPAGGAAVFSCGLLHRVEPVEKGARFACLTFVYDQHGHAIRQRNWAQLKDAEPA